MNHWKRLVSGLLWLGALPLLAQSGNPSSTSTGSGTKQGVSVVTHAVHQSDGERAFQQNCSRCHNAPQGFPPQISGTIVRHMRVRASLSEKDAQAILRFFHP